jgi:hypothetical protein
MAPLQSILTTLENRGGHAVFYIAGPGSDQAAGELGTLFADGLTAIHQGGHILGYHAFVHDRNIWANPLLPGGILEPIMNNDLDRLVKLIDDSTVSRSVNRAGLFSPIFRQPYGGLGLFAYEGANVAAQRGLVYHGYHIDSGDWLSNADADPKVRSRFGGDSEDTAVEFVRSRLRAGVAANQGCGSIDVLFHVNSFTAAHLNLWIDELTAARGQISSSGSAQGPDFSVPDTYMRDTDTYVDTGTGADLLGPQNQ